MKNHKLSRERCFLFPGLAIIILAGIHGLNGEEPQRPNIVLMLADDLGWSDLSCYGSAQVKTPHIDSLAEDGLKFTDFYAGSAVCSPSRACLLTGRYPVRAGVYSWIHTSHRMLLRDEEVTIAEMLKELDYATVHSGKWHLGYQLENGSGDQPDPGDQGFDYWMATGNNAVPSHRNPQNFVRNGVAVGETEGYSCQLVVDEALDWYEKHRDPAKPFFMNIWFHEPHARVAAPEHLRARHMDTRNPDYYGCIENLDLAVGRLLDHLDRKGVAENTIVIFTSDNGSYMEGSNGNLRGRKTQLWEGGIREVGLMRWPGRISPGSNSSFPCGLVDVFPTLAAAVGGRIPSDRIIDGIDLTPVFGGRTPMRQRPLYWFYNPSRPVCVVRSGLFSLIADPVMDLPRGNMFLESYIPDIKKTGLTNFRLYDHSRDPGQEMDVSHQFPEIFEELKASMHEIHRSVVDEAYDWSGEK